jgi:hypothetical protein
LLKPPQLAERYVEIASQTVGASAAVARTPRRRAKS